VLIRHYRTPCNQGLSGVLFSLWIGAPIHRRNPLIGHKVCHAGWMKLRDPCKERSVSLVLAVI